MDPNMPTPNFDISLAADIVCERCGNYTFQEALLMKKVSALVSPTGKEGVVPIPTFICATCGHINYDFLPPYLKQAQTDEPPTDTPRKGGLILEK